MPAPRYRVRRASRAVSWSGVSSGMKSVRDTVPLCTFTSPSWVGLKSTSSTTNASTTTTTQQKCDNLTLIYFGQTLDMIDNSVLVPGTEKKIGLYHLDPAAGSADFAIIEGGFVTSLNHRDRGTTPPFNVGDHDLEITNLENYSIIIKEVDPINHYLIIEVCGL